SPRGYQFSFRFSHKNFRTPRFRPRRGPAFGSVLPSTAAKGTILSMPDAKPLARKVALITGAAKRLGKAAAVALAHAGADVAITFLRSEKEARQTISHLEKTGVRGLALPCDVTQPNSIRD